MPRVRRKSPLCASLGDDHQMVGPDWHVQDHAGCGIAEEWLQGREGAAGLQTWIAAQEYAGILQLRLHFDRAGRLVCAGARRQRERAAGRLAMVNEHGLRSEN